MVLGGSLLGVIILILDLWAILSIVQSGETVVAKLIWILLILALPVIGLIIWLVAGPRGRLLTG